MEGFARAMIGGMSTGGSWERSLAGTPRFGGYFLDPTSIVDGAFVTRFVDERFGPGWLVFSNPEERLTAGNPAQVLDLLMSADRAIQAGKWAAGFVAYEAAVGFDSAMVTQPAKPEPLAIYHVYDNPPEFFKELSCDEVKVALNWESEADEAWFSRQFEAVKEHLRHGDSYQVNLSYRARSESAVEIRTLFARLAASKPPSYASLFMGEEVQIASLSPELFLAVGSGRIRCKPMKGTVKFDGDYRAGAGALRSSPKERAENLMVTDMIRNDLSKIAEVGSVRVSELFGIEPFGEVLQMTSTIEAAFCGSVSEAFAALFPCASIVGAPKVQTMRIISELEQSPRGAYTGALGFMGPHGSRFSVGIRTISRSVRHGILEYGTGGGIVWDSDSAAEWNETRLKTLALNRTSKEWALFETMGWPDTGRVSLHLERLAQSAATFGIEFDPDQARRAVQAACGDSEMRVRLSLSQAGVMSVEACAVPQKPSMLRSTLARIPVQSGDPSLRFKTNRRSHIDRELRMSGLNEVLLWNERGEATEFCKGNLVAEIDGRLVTPPLDSGLLPGVLRRTLLESGEITESKLLLKELEVAAHVWRINSLTGWIPVRVQKDVD